MIVAKAQSWRVWAWGMKKSWQEQISHTEGRHPPTEEERWLRSKGESWHHP